MKGIFGRRGNTWCRKQDGGLSGGRQVRRIGAEELMKLGLRVLEWYVGDVVS